jgi:hypothetical protein
MKTLLLQTQSVAIFLRGSVKNPHIPYITVITTITIAIAIVVIIASIVVPIADLAVTPVVGILSPHGCPNTRRRDTTALMLFYSERGQVRAACFPKEENTRTRMNHYTLHMHRHRQHILQPGGQWSPITPLSAVPALFLQQARLASPREVVDSAVTNTRVREGPHVL